LEYYITLASPAQSGVYGRSSKKKSVKKILDKINGNDNDSDIQNRKW